MTSRNVYPAGFMGFDKGTVGCNLAERCQIPFEDLDNIIVNPDGKSVEELAGSLFGKTSPWPWL